jgi:hypothetical protein
MLQVRAQIPRRRCRVAARRWQDFTKRDAVQQATGRSVRLSGQERSRTPAVTENPNEAKHAGANHRTENNEVGYCKGAAMNSWSVATTWLLLDKLSARCDARAV